MCDNGNRTCSDGFVAHDRAGVVGGAPHCNGFGWVRASGKPFLKRSGARNLEASASKRLCPGCIGTGMVACGCVDHGLRPGTLECAAGVELAPETIRALVAGDVVDLDVVGAA